MPRQTGFTLIEILVTVIVLAIGLLGLAGLQATSLSFNSTAYQRSQATNLAYDIADRMRANVVAARGGAYNVNFGFAAPGGATLAATDLREWRQALINALPAGTGQIAPDAGGNNIFTISIQWDDSRGQENLQQFDMMTEL
jgi:type IV pilus assembly protein PilV